MDHLDRWSCSTGYSYQEERDIDGHGDIGTWATKELGGQGKNRDQKNWDHASAGIKPSPRETEDGKLSHSRLRHKCREKAWSR